MCAESSPPERDALSAWLERWKEWWVYRELSGYSKAEQLTGFLFFLIVTLVLGVLGFLIWSSYCMWRPLACPLTITVYSSDTKQDWLDAVSAAFNQTEFVTSAGHPIAVQVTHVKSGSSMQDILDDKIQPIVWSPGEQTWVDSANQAWQETRGRPLIPDPCPATVYAPVGFAMWRPMAEAMGWPAKPVGWNDIVALAADPEGWARYGHPEWGPFKFGHTHPDHSNSGLLILTALAYAVFDAQDGLTAQQVQSDPFVEAMRAVEMHTYHYGVSSRDNITRMVQMGPNYLHATNTTEAETLRANSGVYGEARFPLAFVFPAGGTYWAEQPYCILDGKWSSQEEREAARMFRDYLLQREQQRLAVAHYLRPVDASIPLTAPFSLDNGTDPAVTPELIAALESPPPSVTDAIKAVFHQTKKPLTVLVALDKSGSMSGAKMDQAKAATSGFVEGLRLGDEVYAYTFSGSVEELEPFGGAVDVKSQLVRTVGGVRSGGDTALYDAVCHAARRAEGLRTQDLRDGEQRLYGVVVLSDGNDTASSITESMMFDCLPAGEGVEGVKFFTIAYGSDANEALLGRIAEQTLGKTYTANPDSIDKVYLDISAQ